MKISPKNIVVTVVTVIVALLVIYFWGTAPAPKIAPLGDFTVASTTLSDSGMIAGQSYTVTVYYPVVSGAQNAATFNAYALTLVRSQVDDFKTAVSQSDVSNLPPEIKNLANTFNIRYSVDGTSTDYVSVLFGSETYLLGMAHPAHLLTSLNVDLRSGAVIGLTDLFKPGSDYLQKLSDISTADLLSQIQSGEYGSTPDFLSQTGGASASADNFQVFGLSPQGLVIHFQDYQVGPGAAGPATVVIPYGDLKDVAAPGGFLDK